MDQEIKLPETEFPERIKLLEELKRIAPEVVGYNPEKVEVLVRKEIDEDKRDQIRKLVNNSNLKFRIARNIKIL